MLSNFLVHRLITISQYSEMKILNLDLAESLRPYEIRSKQKVDSLVLFHCQRDFKTQNFRNFHQGRKLNITMT